MNNLDIVNVCLEIWVSVLLLIISICMILLGRKKDKIDRLFLALAGVNIISLITDVISTFLVQKYFLPNAGSFFKYISFICVNFVIYILVMFTWEHIRRVSQLEVPKWLRHTENILVVFSSLLLTVNCFYPVLFHASEGEGYHRMELFPVVHATYGAMLILDMAAIIKSRRKIGNRNVYILLGYLVVATAAELIPRAPGQPKFDQLGIGLVILILYVRLQAEIAPKMEQQKKALDRDRASVMINQMQSDLLFESLEVIQSISETNPKEAAEAVNHFASYLRENMDNLTRTTMIPIEIEMRHVMDYLYIEQLWIPDIKVDYIKSGETFLIPPHTIQPLIEILIRNDFAQRSDGMIKIGTSSIDNVDFVIITDNGTGKCLEKSNLSEQNKRTIEEIEKRLSAMCNGSLETESSSLGTRIILTIRHQKEKV